MSGNGKIINQLKNFMINEKKLNDLENNNYIRFNFGIDSPKVCCDQSSAKTTNVESYFLIIYESVQYK